MGGRHPDRQHQAGGAAHAQQSHSPLARGGRGQPVGMVSLGDLAVERDPGAALGDISAAPLKT
jgi:hypothetical protein